MHVYLPAFALFSTVAMCAPLVRVFSRSYTGPAPSSTGPGVASTSGSKLGQVPGFAMAMQSGLLKRINSFRSKEVRRLTQGLQHVD